MYSTTPALIVLWDRCTECTQRTLKVATRKHVGSGRRTYRFCAEVIIVSVDWTNIVESQEWNTNWTSHIQNAQRTVKVATRKHVQGQVSRGDLWDLWCRNQTKHWLTYSVLKLSHFYGLVNWTNIVQSQEWNTNWTSHIQYAPGRPCKWPYQK